MERVFIAAVFIRDRDVLGIPELHRDTYPPLGDVSVFSEFAGKANATMHETANDLPRIASFALKGGYEDADLDLLCDEIETRPRLREEIPGHSIDLREARALSPSALALVVGTVCTVASQPDRKEPVTILPPESEDAPLCLQAEILHSLIDGGPGHWQANDDGELIGVEVFSSPGGIDRVIASIQQNLTLNTVLPEASLRSVRTMVFEVAENVIQHSKAHRGVVALQFRPETETFSVAIYDNGIGIRRSLTRNPKFQDLDDDLAAIAASMGAGATAEPGTGGGMGLFLARLVLRDNGGRLTIRSGSARREEGDDISDSTLLPSLHGTLVTIYARADRPFDYARIDDALVKPAGVGDRHPYEGGPAT